jgi:hypothetical protein
MLHILTALYRFENLERIYNSLYMDNDITWHICKSNKREDIDSELILNDKRVKIHNIDCEDEDLVSKRVELLKNVTNGYFCFLDDDTIFHPNLYVKYRDCLDHNFIGMMVGEQLDWDGKLRLIASKPVFRMIDIGNVICHHSCLKGVKWPIEKPNEFVHRDFLFWDSVFNYFGKKCAIINLPISHYNKLSQKKIKHVKYRPNDEKKTFI